MTIEGNVGIGTTAPATKLHLYDSSSGPIITLSGSNSNYRGLTIKDTAGSEQWFYGPNNSNNFVVRRSGSSDYITVNSSTGNVGIGTTNPSEKLTVNGNIYTTGQLSLGGTLIGASSNVLNIGAFGVAISNPSALTYLDLENVATVRVQATAGGESSIGTKDDADFSIRTNDTKRITISRDGNVGIGTTNPGAKLDVAGDIKVSGSYITIPFTDTEPPAGDCNENNKGRMVVFLIVYMFVEVKVG